MGVNRLSFGVQSLVDREAAATGRFHTRAVVLKDLERVRSAGLRNLSIDLIAGMPHQTAASWQESLDALVATGVEHASIYMLEIDEDSRLGRELLAGGSRYHAGTVPSEELTADLYQSAIAFLEQNGLRQYEISNFARTGLPVSPQLEVLAPPPVSRFRAGRALHAPHPAGPRLALQQHRGAVRIPPRPRSRGGGAPAQPVGGTGRGLVPGPALE